MKHMKYYAVFWIMLMILFNMVCFITPDEWYGISKYSGGFWSGYGFITASFIIHFVYAFYTFGEKNKEKRIINTPLTIISFAELGIMIAIGILCMAVPSFPYWLGSISCYAVLAFSVIFLLSAKVVGENASNTNIALNIKTSPMRNLADKAQELATESQTPEIRNITAKVYDAIRYSDTVSSQETQMSEMQISDGLEELEFMIRDNTDLEIIQRRVDTLLLLVEKRNNKCKALKQQV